MGELGDYLGGTANQANTMSDELTGTGESVALADQISADITPEHRTLLLLKNIPNGSTLFWA